MAAVCAMFDYRLYSLDASGHIVRSPVEFESASDDDAIETAQQYRDGSDMELWQRNRLVKAFPKLD